MYASLVLTYSPGDLT